MAGLLLVLAESALEVVPRSLWGHPSVLSHSRRVGKPPKLMILDRSYHHSAMRSLKRDWKRGRPDIVHFCLLEALGSPLNREGLLEVYVHTLNDYVISISPETRLPRNYNRFIGLIEQLFELGRVPPEGKVLLKIRRENLKVLIDRVKPSYKVALSRAGKPKLLQELMGELSKEDKPMVVVGGFPIGRFEEETLSLMDDVVSIDPETLEAWTVVSRVIYDYERAIGLPERRIERAGGNYING